MIHEVTIPEENCKEANRSTSQSVSDDSEVFLPDFDISNDHLRQTTSDLDLGGGAVVVNSLNDMPPQSFNIAIARSRMKKAKKKLPIPLPSVGRSGRSGEKKGSNGNAVVRNHNHGGDNSESVTSEFPILTVENPVYKVHTK